MPIMNIAFACGFVSASHFSTCYRQMYGKTPRAERSSLGALDTGARPAQASLTCEQA